MLKTFMKRASSFFTSGLLITAVSVSATGGAAIAQAPPPPVRPVLPLQGKTTLPQKASTAESRVVENLLSVVGAPYTPKGSSPKEGFSTPGLLHWSFRTQGVVLPESARAQWFMASPAAPAEVAPGTIAHAGALVGVVVGPDRIIYASPVEEQVIVESFAHFASGNALHFARVSFPSA
jgi:cell wall-associated NlpC family hydrolase